MDAVRGCGDCPPCPGFKHGGTCPTEEVLSNPHTFSIINNRLKALMEDEGQEDTL